MHLEISLETPQSEKDRGPVTVGWFFNTAKGTVIYEAPSRVQSGEKKAKHAKSASACPAILNYESRIFEVPSPIDLILSFERNSKGEAGLRARGGPRNAVRSPELKRMIALTREEEWRHPDRPIIQMALPYVFVSDEPVYLNQISPFLRYRENQLPGIMFSGRFPINVWPRPLMWSFEWHDTKADLYIKRGEPLFYVQFETAPQNRPIQLVEAERTKDLEEYTEMISGAVSYVNQTFSLFSAAEERRPKRLVVPKLR